MAINRGNQFSNTHPAKNNNSTPAPMTQKPKSGNLTTNVNEIKSYVKIVKKQTEILTNQVRNNGQTLTNVLSNQNNLATQQGMSQSNLNQSLSNTNTTLAALGSKVDDVRGDQAVIQSLLNRVKALEDKPDEQQKLLVEYVRNFDTTNQLIGKVQEGQATFATGVQTLLKKIATYVQKKKIMVDASTIEELRAVVEKKTNNKLGEYIGNVQRESIEKQFNQLAKAINDQEAPIKRKMNDMNGQLNELDDKISQLGQIVVALFWLMIATLSAGIFSGFILWFKGFKQHPVVSVIALIVISILVAWLYHKAEQEDSDNE